MTDNNPTTSSPASIDPINDAVRALEVLGGGGGLSPDETAELVRGLLAVIDRLSRERDDAAVYSRDVCYAVENVRVMIAGTLDALDAARARLGTVGGSAWPTT